MIIYQEHNSLGNHNYNAFFYENCEWFYHFHKNYELVCVEEGEVMLTLSGSNFTMKKGDYAIIFPNEFHSYHTPESSYVWIGVFSADYVGEFDRAMKTRRTKDPVFRCSGAADNYLHQILITDRTPDIFVMKSALYAACGEFLKTAILYDAKNENNLAHEIISYMEENFRSDISLQEIAELYGYEYHYLSRQFHRLFHINFKRFLSIYRADYARDLLIHSDADITEIAHLSGFQSIRTFNRVFLEQTGMTPSEYRERAAQV
ncbi:MAG: helix-turn-helix transcriptional regulator [Lachnospiraceae bacterium]|nr:helix-turn-helix transcriptional regulator [Lachnospiraceae bacterium]